MVCRRINDFGIARAEECGGKTILDAICPEGYPPNGGYVVLQRLGVGDRRFLPVNAFHGPTMVELGSTQDSLRHLPFRPQGRQPLPT